MKPTDTSDPDYYHRVVDCQYACPAHTPVPEYIRLIAAQEYTQAYFINWESNVFPGVLGRTCDRPCEPACRRDRMDEKPVAICRLKRVAADNSDDIRPYLPKVPEKKNGKHIALIGAGPASLGVARDLLPLGYEITIFDIFEKGGGMMRSQIPAFRLPIEVLDYEVDLILEMGVNTRFGTEITSMKSVLDEGYDAIFVGTGAPRGREIDIPGRQEASENIHIGIDWLSSVAFGHTTKVGKRVVVLGGGNTAMDCCRTARRIGGTEVDVVVRSGFDEMKASPWEIEEAEMEDIPIHNFLVPKEFHLNDAGKLCAVTFDKVERQVDENGRRQLIPTGEEQTIECDDVLVAIGQENSFPWIERDIGIEFDPRWDMPIVDKVTMRCSHEKIFFGGDAAWGPENIIWAVAHSHEAALSIHKYLEGEDITDRPPPHVTKVSQKMGIHEWSFDNDISNSARVGVPHADKKKSLGDYKMEVELGFDIELGYKEAMRCLNCDVQTVFSETLCIECDACTDICPTDCITFTENGDETDLRTRLTAPAENGEQAILVSDILKTGRVMIKDEDVCLHCGLCAERCPTNAWDMQKFLFNTAKTVEICLP
ncbi:MAG: formate dehydrogenase beta subunit [Gammaproteobacteria bacterium]